MGPARLSSGRAGGGLGGLAPAQEDQPGLRFFLRYLGLFLAFRLLRRLELLGGPVRLGGLHLLIVISGHGRDQKSCRNAGVTRVVGDVPGDGRDGAARRSGPVRRTALVTAPASRTAVGPLVPGRVRPSQVCMFQPSLIVSRAPVPGSR